MTTVPKKTPAEQRRRKYGRCWNGLTWTDAGHAEARARAEAACAYADVTFDEVEALLRVERSA